MWKKIKFEEKKAVFNVKLFQFKIMLDENPLLITCSYFEMAVPNCVYAIDENHAWIK